MASIQRAAIMIVLEHICGFGARNQLNLELLSCSYKAILYIYNHAYSMSVCPILELNEWKIDGAV